MGGEENEPLYLVRETSGTYPANRVFIFYHAHSIIWNEHDTFYHNIDFPKLPHYFKWFKIP